MKAILLSISFFLGITSLSAQPTLHAILVCSAKEGDIGVDCRVDLENFKNMTKRCAELLSWRYDPIIIKSKKVYAHRLVEAIKHMKSSQEDTIFFYYSGHGDNHSDGPLPHLTFTKGHEMSARNILSRLKKLPNRNVIAVFECCNVLHKHFKRDLKLNESYNDITEETARLLFEQFQGVFVGVAAGVGYASCSNDEGAFYSNLFLDYIAEEKEGWEHVARIIEQPCFYHPSDPQYPFHILERKK